MGTAVVEKRHRRARVAAADKATAAEALETLGGFTFKGWRQTVFPGWHDEPAYRPKALAALRASLKADPTRASAQKRCESLGGRSTLPTAYAVETSRPLPIRRRCLPTRNGCSTRAITTAPFELPIRPRRHRIASSPKISSAYQMPEQAQGFLARHARAAAIAGVALFKRGDLANAIKRLEEAERLYQGLDVTNQIALGDVERATRATARAITA